MRFDPQANFFVPADARKAPAQPAPAMTLPNPLKAASVIVGLGFLAGLAFWLWAEGVPFRQRAAAATPDTVTGRVAEDPIVQYAEAVTSGEGEAAWLAAVTGESLDPEAARLLARHGRSSEVREAFKAGKKRMAMGRHAEAVPYFEKVLDEDPEYAEAHYRLGLAYVHTGDLTAARREYKTLMRIDPDRANLLLHLVDIDG